MGSSGPGRIIGLHNVELRAPVTVDLISITIAPAICINPRVTRLVLAGHGDRVEGSGAPTVNLAEVNIVLDVSIQQIRCPVIGIVHI